jgi:hypothetical protein
MSLMTARQFFTRYGSTTGRAVLKGTGRFPERWLINVRTSDPGAQGDMLYLCHESQRVPMRISDTSIVLPSRPPRHPRRKRIRKQK